MTSTYAGSRLAVLPNRKTRHFFYKTEPPPCPRVCLETLAQLAKPYLTQQAVADHIAVLTRQELVEACGSDAGSAWDGVANCLAHIAEHAQDDFEIVGCQWAEPHVDPGFLGEAFYSVVLHTGPFRYRMRALHTRRRTENGESFFEVISSTRALTIGDAFVFDPCTPHMVLPEHPHEDELLVLMQTKFADADEEDRIRLLERIRPLPDDQNLEL